MFSGELTAVGGGGGLVVGDVFVLDVHGMYCHNCVDKIDKELMGRDGVISCKVSLQLQEAVVQFDSKLITVDDLIKAIDSLLEFKAHLQPHVCVEAVVAVEGMTCSSCVRTIDSCLTGADGVKFNKVSLDHNAVYVKYDPSLTSSERICDIINELGFEASLTPPDGLKMQREMEKPPKQDEPEAYSTVNITVEGMTCNSCVTNIETNMKIKTGVKTIKVSLELNVACVDYYPEKTDPATLRSQIDDLGYDAILQVDSLGGADVLVDVEGMTCSSCVAGIESELGKILGVRSINVSLEDKQAGINYDKTETTPNILVGYINDLGYVASLVDDVKKKTSTGTHLISEPDVAVHAAPSKERPLLNTPGDTRDAAAAASGSDEDEDAATDRCFIRIAGMTCSSCVHNIEKGLGRDPGVRSVLVSLMAQKAEVRYDPTLVLPDRIAALVVRMGYSASVMETQAAGQGTVDIMVRGNKQARLALIMVDRKYKAAPA